MGIKLTVAAVVGLLLGFVFARYLLFLAWISLVPWGLAGLLIGISCRSYREAILAGGIYGFLLSFAFLLAGYQGSAPIISPLPFFVLLGLFGAVCGAGLGAAGCFVRRKIRRGS